MGAILRIEKFDKGLVAARVEHDRIAESVAADRFARGSDSAGSPQVPHPVPERQPAPSEAGRMAKESDHCVAGAVS